MRAQIRIVRDRDQSVLEEDIADISDSYWVGKAISDLLDRIRTAHPRTELLDLTIKVDRADNVA